MDNTNKPLVNRVAASGLITFKLEDLFPKEKLLVFDIKDYLFKGLILREKDFRAALNQHDWKQYEGKHLAVYCSADAIIPIWAYMLVVAYAEPYAKSIVHGEEKTFYQTYFQKAIENLDISQYKGKRMVIKGCSDLPVPSSAYVELTRRLRPIAQSIMYGEPCSTVPIFKQPRK